MIPQRASSCFPLPQAVRQTREAWGNLLVSPQRCQRKKMKLQSHSKHQISGLKKMSSMIHLDDLRRKRSKLREEARRQLRTCRLVSTEYWSRTTRNQQLMARSAENSERS